MLIIIFFTITIFFLCGLRCCWLVGGILIILLCYLASVLTDCVNFWLYNIEVIFDSDLNLEHRIQIHTFNKFPWNQYIILYPYFFNRLLKLQRNKKREQHRTLLHTWQHKNICGYMHILIIIIIIVT